MTETAQAPTVVDSLNDLEITGIGEILTTEVGAMHFRQKWSTYYEALIREKSQGRSRCNDFVHELLAIDGITAIVVVTPKIAKESRLILQKKPERGWGSIMPPLNVAIQRFQNNAASLASLGSLFRI